MKTTDSTNVTLDKDTRWTYVNVWEPKTSPVNSIPKYSVKFVISKENTNLMKKIDEAIYTAYLSNLCDKIEFSKINLPYFDGDETDRPEFANSFVLRASSVHAPHIVDINGNHISAHSEIHSGVYGRAKVHFYTFVADNRIGVACELRALQKVKDGESTATRPSADDDFSNLDD